MLHGAQYKYGFWYSYMFTEHCINNIFFRKSSSKRTEIYFLHLLKWKAQVYKYVKCVCVCVCVCMYQLLKHVTNCHKPCSNFMTLEVTQCLTFQFSSMSNHSMANTQICVTVIAYIQPAIMVCYSNNNLKKRNHMLKSW